MTNNNNYPIYLPKTYTVSYFDEAEWNKDLTQNDLKQQEIINASYHAENQAEERGYGPCRNTSCGCFCSNDECYCSNPEFSIYKESSRKIGNGTASGGTSLGGNAVSGDAAFTLYRDSRSNGDLKVGTVSVGTYLVNGGFGGAVRASADVMSFKTDGVEVRAGLSLDTGATISENGLELKLAGFGVSIGEKMEISTAAGSVACIIQ
jgi:hypothetical protein